MRWEQPLASPGGAEVAAATLEVAVCARGGGGGGTPRSAASPPCGFDGALPF